jgi:hypothetical protein
VAEIVYPDGCEIPQRWKEDFDISHGMLSEAGVKVRSA